MLPNVRSTCISEEVSFHCPAACSAAQVPSERASFVILLVAEGLPGRLERQLHCRIMAIVKQYVYPLNSDLMEQTRSSSVGRRSVMTGNVILTPKCRKSVCADCFDLRDCVQKRVSGGLRARKRLLADSLGSVASHKRS